MNQGRNRTWADEHEVTLVGGTFESVTASNPTVQNGSVKSVVRNGVGDYTVTFRETFPFGRMPYSNHRSTSLQGIKVTALDPVLGTMDVLIYALATGVAADGPAGTTIDVGYEAINTKVRFRN